jgi:hypothetical protein
VTLRPFAITPPDSINNTPHKTGNSVSKCSAVTGQGPFIFLLNSFLLSKAFPHPLPSPLPRPAPAQLDLQLN